MEKIKPATILLEEDDLGDQKLITVSLKNQKLGNEVHIAGSGEEAMDFLYQRGKYSHGTSRPDLILLDIMMPGLTTQEILNNIDRDRRLAEVKIIFMTAIHLLEAEERGLLASQRVVDFIKKPFTIKRMLDAIEKNT